jgi:hypothetical protein
MLFSESRAQWSRMPVRWPERAIAAENRESEDIR